MEMTIQLNNVQDAGLFVAQCNEYAENIDYRFDHYIVDAKSLLGVISAGFNKNVSFLSIHLILLFWINSIKTWKCGGITYDFIAGKTCSGKRELYLNFVRSSNIRKSLHTLQDLLEIRK